MRTLHVYLHADLAGHLTLQNNGRMTFQYAESWLDSDTRMPLSNSLPLQAARFPQRACAPFFSGVLPESGSRATIARVLGLSAENDFALLEAIGGECAGAVCLLPEGSHPNQLTPELRPLPPDELAKVLAELPTRPLLAGTDGYRMSLAGAQSKVALAVVDGELFLPVGSAPSTHILKPAEPYYEGIVFNEALCLSLAAACGLSAASCSLESAGGIDYLLVERFDRERHHRGDVQRIHQEDCCQALGVRSEAKYQSEGGPGLGRIFELARTVSSAPVIDIARLLDAVLFNAVVGNNDAHAKNFAWLRHRDGRTRLAPLYDLVCTVAYPALTARMAMRIGRAREFDQVGEADLRRCAKEAGLNAPLVVRRARELVAIILDRLDEVEQPHSASRRTAMIVRQRAEQLASRLGANA